MYIKARSGLAVISLIAITLFLTLAGIACISVQYPVKETYYENEAVTENRTEAFTETVPVIQSIPGEQVLRPDILWNNTALLFRGNENIWYYGYDLDGLPPHNAEKIRLLLLKQLYYEQAVINVFDMRSQGQILAHPQISPADNLPTTDVGQNWISAKTGYTVYEPWLNLANIKLNFAGTLAGFSDVGLNSAANHLVEVDSRGSRHIAIIVSGPLNPQNVRFTVSLAWSDNVTEYMSVNSQRSAPVQTEKPAAKQRTTLQTRLVPLWSALFGQ